MRLKDRVVLITGAGGTIGSEVTRVLSAHGAKLAVTDMATTPLQTIMDEIGSADGTIWGRRADAADFDDFSAFVERHEVLGPPDALVNVAGTSRSPTLSVPSRPSGPR